MFYLLIGPNPIGGTHKRMILVIELYQGLLDLSDQAGGIKAG